MAVSDSNDTSQPSLSTTLTLSKDASYLGELNFYFLRHKTQRFRYINSPANDRYTLPWILVNGFTPFMTLLIDCNLTGGRQILAKHFSEISGSTLVLLTFIWHTVYAWDEALKALYNHIYTVVSHTSDTYLLRSCWRSGE